MARLDDIISGRSGYDCSAAASAKWSNGLGALSSSTFLVYKYIARACVSARCCSRRDVARLCNCPSWNRPTDRIRLFYFIANAAQPSQHISSCLPIPVQRQRSMSTNCFLYTTVFYATMCASPYLVESLSESALRAPIPFSISSSILEFSAVRLRNKWMEYALVTHIRRIFSIMSWRYNNKRLGSSKFRI